ncbi:MAG: hypothetical protein V8S89_06965 [Oscillospiraceae bacterium]
METLRYQNGFVCNRQGNALYSIRDIALHHYDLQQAHVICARKTTQLKTNALKPRLLLCRSRSRHCHRQAAPW